MVRTCCDIIYNKDFGSAATSVTSANVKRNADDVIHITAFLQRVHYKEDVRRFCFAAIWSAFPLGWTHHTSEAHISENERCNP